MQALIAPARQHPRRLFILALGGAAAVVCALIAALGQAPAARAVTAVHCGDVLTASTTLQTDLHCDGGPALAIGKLGITLNLNGHTVSGSGEYGIGTETGQRYANVTITNGTVDGYTTAIRVDGGGWKISKMRLHGTGAGIGVDARDKAAVSASTIWGLSYGVIVRAGAGGSSVTQNSVSAAAITGIYVAAPATVSTNHVAGSRYGIVITEDPAAPVTLAGNIVTGNDDAGLVTNTPLTVLNSNVVDDNGHHPVTGSSGPYGTKTGGGVTDDGKNVAQDNADAPQCGNVVCR